MFAAELQSKLLQTASNGPIRTNVGVVLAYESFGQKSHDHCYENNGEIYCCKQLSLEYELCCRESAKKKDNHK